MEVEHKEGAKSDEHTLVHLAQVVENHFGFGAEPCRCCSRASLTAEAPSFVCVSLRLDCVAQPHLAWTQGLHESTGAR